MSRAGFVRFIARILGVSRVDPWWERTLDPESVDNARILGEEARQVIESRAYKLAVGRMQRNLERNILGCNPEEKENIQRVVITKQLFHGFQREFTRMMSDAEAADMQIEQHQQRRFQR